MKFPPKNTSDEEENKNTSCQILIHIIEAEGGDCELLKNKQPLNLLKETVADDQEQLEFSKDQNARMGHKSADPSFFDNKPPIAMTEEGMITAAAVTTKVQIDFPKQKTSFRSNSKSSFLAVCFTFCK